jgi:type II secretory pathway pseudopilin PulG
MLNKKGAMFGLDARIALAIFGALSVISGAALYSAIQESKSVQILTTLNEFNKAVEAYMLDTGENLSHDLSSLPTGSFRNIDNLLNSTGSAWKGPYLTETNHEELDPGGNVIRTSLGDFYIQIIGTVDWTSSPASHPTCSDANGCVYWSGFCVSDNSMDSIFKDIDLKVDGKDDQESGNLRYMTWASGDVCVYLKGPATLGKIY